MPVSKILHKSYQSMHSALDIVLTGIDTSVGEQVCSGIGELAERTERILSCHLPGAEVYELNANACNRYVPVSRSLLNILLECRRYHQLTRGYFDIGLKHIKNSLENNDSPISAPGMDTVEINEGQQTVRYWSEDTGIDLGGLGKGILLREAGKVLDHYQIANCFISFGGSSILTRGSHPHGTGWPVSLRNDSSFTFYMNNDAASFSESHQVVNHKPHIIHPKIKRFAENNRITFVQATCPVLAEVLSTTLVIVPLEEAGDIIPSAQVVKAYIMNNTDQHNFSIEYQYGN